MVHVPMHIGVTRKCLATRERAILAQKVFMCPVSPLQARDTAENEDRSRSEIIREALREELRV